MLLDKNGIENGHEFYSTRNAVRFLAFVTASLHLRGKSKTSRHPVLLLSCKESALSTSSAIKSVRHRQRVQTFADIEHRCDSSYRALVFPKGTHKSSNAVRDLAHVPIPRTIHKIAHLSQLTISCDHFRRST